ncbi:hypothetical protein HpDR4_24340 [Helicobacter pylori]
MKFLALSIAFIVLNIIEYELEYFFKNSIERVFSKIADTHIIYKLNNQGRRVEEVCFFRCAGF